MIGDALRRGCAGHPMFAVALATAGCVVAASHGWMWGWLMGGVVAGVAYLTIGWRVALAWMMCGWLAVVVYGVRDGERSEAEKQLVGVAASVVKGRVVKDARGDRYWAAPVKLLDGAHAGVLVWWQGRGGEMPVAGSEVTGQGDFEALPEARNEGEFDRAGWLRSQGVAVVFNAVRFETQVVTGRWAALGAAVRRGFRERVTAGLGESTREAQVIRAVVIGESPQDADALITAFRNSGTLHAFSVSGLHVAMVGSAGWFLLGMVGVPRRWAVCILLPLVFGYSWITGNSAPAVRSAWMAAVFLGAFVFRRKPDLLNALGAVLLGALLWDGRLLFLAGVQLSYGVVAAIALGTSWAAKAFKWLEMPELYEVDGLMPRWRKYWLKLRIGVARSLSVSFAAGVGSAPLTAWHFGLVTPVSVLAGLVLIPLVFVILVVALISVMCSPMLTVSHGINRLNGRVAALSVVAAEWFSAIPGGHWQIRCDRRPVLRVYDLDRGEGAAVFAGGSDGAVMIDCGGELGFKNRFLPSLRRLGLEPDAVVLSHPDGGHLGGGAAVWNALPIRRALVPVMRSRSPSYREWMDDSPQAGVRLLLAKATQVLPFPDQAVLEVVSAPSATAAVSALADDRVAIYRLHWRGWILLFTSDAGLATESKLLASGRDISADVIIAGCHRTDVSLGDAFVDAVHPRVMVVSNAKYPPVEVRSNTSISYWRSRGIVVMDQGQSGGITVRVDAAGCLCLEGFLDHAPVVLNPRR